MFNSTFFRLTAKGAKRALAAAFGLAVGAGMMAPQLANAQFNNTNAVAVSSGTYSAITAASGSGYTNLTNGTTRFDDEVWNGSATTPTTSAAAGFTIPFTFTHGLASFNRFAVNANGYIRLWNNSSNATVSVANSYSVLGSSITPAPGATLAALNADLGGNNAQSISFTTLGTTPNRVLVIQWANMQNYTGAPPGADNLNFQVRLNESDGKAQYVYGSSLNFATAPYVGWRANGTTGQVSYLSGAWAAPSQGTSSTTMSSSPAPANGLTYTVYLPTCPAATLSAAPAAYPNGSQATLTIGGTAPGIGYQYRYAPTATGVFNAPTAAASSTTSLVVSGLTKATAYTFQVRKICSVGDTSAWASASATTANTCNAATTLTVGSITTTSASASVSGLPTNGALGLQYQVYTSTSPQAGAWSSQTYTGTTATIPITGLSYGSYTIAVRTICGAGDTSANKTASFTTTAPTATGFGAGWDVTKSTITFNSISATGTPVPWRNYSATWSKTDENISYPITLPFNFTFGGATYTAIVANLNGFAQFDQSVTNQDSYGVSLNGTTWKSVLAPFWQDMVTAGNDNSQTTLNNSIKYTTIGTAPNRQFIIEWIGMEVYAQPSPDLNFQIVLNEGTNVVEYRYA